MRKKMMGGGMMQRPMYKSGGKIKKPKVKKIIAGGMGKAKDYPGIKKIMEMNKEGRKKFKMGGSLKSVPAGNKGLKKLPTEVRNKMGFMKKGGPVAPAPKKDYKLGTKFQGDYKGKSLPGKVKEFVKTGVKQTVGTAKKIARKFKGDK